MEKIIGLKESDFQKMETGYNFIKQHSQELYELLKNNDENLAEEFSKLFYPKLRTIDKRSLGL